MSGGGEAEDPRQHAAQVERLLGDVRASVGPVAWQRVEELVARLVALYGAALGRTLVLVEQAGALDAALRERLCADELVGALLALHGMHPEPPLVRAQAAVERVRAIVGEGAGSVDVALGADGGLALTLSGQWRCGLGRAAVDEALQRALAEAVPEATSIVIGGVDFAAPSPLVQLDLGRSRPHAEPAP